MKTIKELLLLARAYVECLKDEPCYGADYGIGRSTENWEHQEWRERRDEAFLKFSEALTTAEYQQTLWDTGFNV